MSKNYIWENPLTSIMVNGSKHICNLNDSSFYRIFCWGTWQPYWQPFLTLKNVFDFYTYFEQISLFVTGWSTRYSDRFVISVTIPRCYKDVYVNSFFPHTAKLWNSLPIEYFPLTYDLSGFKSRISRNLLTVGSF